MSDNLTAICPVCDDIIEVEDGAQVGDIIGCTNCPCFFEGEIEDIDKSGNVTFKEIVV